MPGVIPEKVNAEQKRAIDHGRGPLLIVAGAGTGKTTVVTERIVHLIMDEQVPSDNILALTFTDKAAGEMQDRVERILPFGYVDLWISTFHSFCQRLLQVHALDIGLSTDFKLLNQTEQWLLIRENLEKFDLEYYRPLGNPTKFISALVKHFSRLKDDDISPAEYIKYAKGLHHGKKKVQLLPAERDADRRILEVAQAYQTYNQLLLDQNSLDFGDLILYLLNLLRQRPAILAKYQKQFQHILVDEFQDTNWAQFELVKKLAAPRNNLTVVGDDDQSIYKFRGASVANILEFRRDFPEADVIVLTKNYRNRQNILDLSYNFIKLNNPDRLEAQINHGGGFVLTKQLQAARQGQGKIELMHVATQEEEARRVADTIDELHRLPTSQWSDFCILVRANDQAETFFQEFERRGLPYTFFAARGLYTKPLVLDVLAYLRVLDNFHDSASLYRVLTQDIFGLPHADIVELSHQAKKRTWSLYEGLQQAAELTLSESGRSGIHKILELLAIHIPLAQTKPVGEVVLRFLNDSGYLKAITKTDDAISHDQVQILNQFFKTIEAFQHAELDTSNRHYLQYLHHILEAGDAGALSQDLDTGPDAIRIMTVHSAKGLEFPYVFIANCVEQRFPGMDRKDPIEVPDALVREVLPQGDAHLQEERRLMYVAITRARDGVFFTAAEDYGGIRRKKPSRFLYELGLLAPPAKAGPKAEPLPVKKFVATSKQTEEAALYNLREKKYSFTKLSTYNTCPWQYRYAFVLQVPKRGNFALSYGQSIHKALYNFFTLWKERQKNSPGQKTPLVTLDELLTAYGRSFVDEWYDSKKQKAEYYDKGKASLATWYKKQAKNMPNTLRLEQVFNLKVDEFVVNGAMDRIDQVGGTEKNPAVKIVDYKTGKYREKFATEDKYQLLIYALAAQDQNILKAEVKELEYYFIDENKTTSMRPTVQDEAQAQAWVKETITKIQSGDFHPTPGIVCKFCDYKEICEFRAS